MDVVSVARGAISERVRGEHQKVFTLFSAYMVELVRCFDKFVRSVDAATWGSYIPFKLCHSGSLVNLTFMESFTRRTLYPQYPLTSTQPNRNEFGKV